MSIPKETLLHAYRTMKTIREFEERVNAEIMNGQIPGFTPSTRVRQPPLSVSAPASTRATPSSRLIGATDTVSPRARKSRA